MDENALFWGGPNLPLSEKDKKIRMSSYYNPEFAVHTRLLCGGRFQQGEFTIYAVWNACNCAKHTEYSLFTSEQRATGQSLPRLLQPARCQGTPTGSQPFSTCRTSQSSSRTVSQGVVPSRSFALLFPLLVFLRLRKWDVLIDLGNTCRRLMLLEYESQKLSYSKKYVYASQTEVHH